MCRCCVCVCRGGTDVRTGEPELGVVVVVGALGVGEGLIYIHICTHAHTYTIHICTRICTYALCTRIYTIHIWTHMHTHVCINTVHLCKHVCIYTIHLCTHICTHTRMHIPMHTHVCIYTIHLCTHHRYVLDQQGCAPLLRLLWMVVRG